MSNIKKALLSFLIVFSTILASCSAPPVTTDTESRDDSDINVGDSSSNEDPSSPSDKESPDDTHPDPSEVKSLYDIKKTDGSKIKIACIGDSITFGTGITNRGVDSYPAKLQKLLGDGYEVGNFGRGGAYILPADSPYNKRENKELSYRDTTQYKDSLSFAPDVVLIMLGANDMLGSMVSEESIRVIESEYEKIINIYKGLQSVKRIYVVSSILATSNVGANMLSDGTVQRMQKTAAKNTGSEYVDVYSLTREYYDTMLHTSDRLHPNDRCTDVLPSAIFSVITGSKYTSIDAPKAESKVVFVSGAGKLTNDGLTPSTSVNSLPLAAGLLREEGGTIVVCGDYNCYKQSATIMPKTKGSITITSVYNGKDYRQSNNARLTLTSTYLYLGGDTVFENVTVNSIAASIIVCNYHDVTFNESVTCTVTGSIAYPIILSGMNVANGAIDKEAVTLTDECNITVNGGTWGYIRNGNRRALGNSTIGSIAKGAKLNLTVNGGEFKTIATQNINALTGMNNVSGEVNFTLNDGIFHGNLNVVCRMGTNQTMDKAVVDGVINVTINGGKINGILAKTQDSSFNISSASINLKVKQSAKANISSISGFDSITETN